MRISANAPSLSVIENTICIYRLSNNQATQVSDPSVLSDLAILRNYGVYVVSGNGAETRDNNVAASVKGQITPEITSNILEAVRSNDTRLVETINQLCERAGSPRRWAGSAFFSVFGGLSHIQIKVLLGYWADETEQWYGWNLGVPTITDEGLSAWDIRIAEKRIATSYGSGIVAHELAHNITFTVERSRHIDLWLSNSEGFGVTMTSDSSKDFETTADGIASWGLDSFTSQSGRSRATKYMETLLWRHICIGSIGGDPSGIPNNFWCDPIHVPVSGPMRPQ